MGSDIRLGTDHAQAQSTTLGEYGSSGATTLPPINGNDGMRPAWLLPWQTGDRQLGALSCGVMETSRTGKMREVMLLIFPEATLAAKRKETLEHALQPGVHLTTCEPKQLFYATLSRFKLLWRVPFTSASPPWH